MFGVLAEFLVYRHVPQNTMCRYHGRFHASFRRGHLPQLIPSLSDSADFRQADPAVVWGSSAVWIMCLVFFQVALLAGYTYAHFVSARLRPRTQVWLHIALLALALWFLPVIPSASWKPASGEDPTWRILGLLTVVLGLPYTLLSSTSPLLQNWYSRRWPDAQPYRLFALSNVAALLALCAYPLWIEPRVATRAQDVVWSAGFAGFAVLAALSAWFARAPANASSETVPGQPIGFAKQATWVALAAGASMLLLSTTNQLTQNVAPVPLLWIVPLAIYLLTFILCFESPRWYRRELFLRLLAVALASVGYAIYDIQESTPIAVALPVFAVGLFLSCMYCHGELSQRKPQGAHLTSFYLMVALGGALGAIFVGLVAPLVFSAIYELPVAMLLVAILAAYLNWNGGWPQRMLLWFCSVTIAMALVLVSGGPEAIAKTLQRHGRELLWQPARGPKFGNQIRCITAPSNTGQSSLPPAVECPPPVTTVPRPAAG